MPDRTQTLSVEPMTRDEIGALLSDESPLEPRESAEAKLHTALSQPEHQGDVGAVPEAAYNAAYQAVRAEAARRSHHAPEPDSVGLSVFAHAAVDAALPYLRSSKPPAPVLSDQERERLEVIAGRIEAEGENERAKRDAAFLRNLASQEHQGEEKGAQEIAWEESGRSALDELFEALTPRDGSEGDLYTAAMLAPHAWAEIKRLRPQPPAGEEERLREASGRIRAAAQSDADLEKLPALRDFLLRETDAAERTTGERIHAAETLRLHALFGHELPVDQRRSLNDVAQALIDAADDRAAVEDECERFFQQRSEDRARFAPSDSQGDQERQVTPIVREAMVLGFCMGALGNAPDPYPKDSAVVERVLQAAESHSDLYPNLAALSDCNPAPTEPQCELCGDTGSAPIAPGIGGVKPCPVCDPIPGPAGRGQVEGIGNQAQVDAALDQACNPAPTQVEGDDEYEGIECDGCGLVVEGPTPADWYLTWPLPDDGLPEAFCPKCADKKVQPEGGDEDRYVDEPGPLPKPTKVGTIRGKFASAEGGGEEGWPGTITLVRDVCDPEPRPLSILSADGRSHVDEFPDEYETRRYVPATSQDSSGLEDEIYRLKLELETERKEGKRRLLDEHEDRVKAEAERDRLQESARIAHEEEVRLTAAAEQGRQRAETALEELAEEFERKAELAEKNRDRSVRYNRRYDASFFRGRCEAHESDALLLREKKEELSEEGLNED